MGILGYELPSEVATSTSWHQHIQGDELDGLWSLSRRLREAATALGPEANPHEERLLALISQTCSMRLTPRAKPVFQPMVRMGTSRSCALEDFDAYDVAALCAVAEHAPVALVCAKLADAAVAAGFPLRLKPWRAGVLAAHAYLEAAERHLLTEAAHGVIDEFRRGFELASWLCREDGALHERYGTLLQNGVSFALGNDDLSTAFELVDEVKHRRLDLAIETAKLLEATADRHAIHPNPDAAANCFDRAGDLWHRAGRRDEAKRCQLLRGEALVSRATSGEGAAYVRAMWLSEGIRVLRNAGADRARVTELRHQLEAFQRASMDDFRGQQVSAHPSDTEVHDILKKIGEVITGPTLFDALLQMAFGMWGCCVHDRVRQQVIDASQKYVLSNLFGVEQVNAEGAPIARQAPLDLNDEGVLYAAMVRHCHDFELKERARLIVSPCADLLFTKYHPSLADIEELTHASVVVPAGHAESLARGLAAGFSDDWLEVVAYLVPKVEPVVRHLFHQQNLITMVLRQDGTHSEGSIDDLLKHSDAKQVLGENLILELNALLVHPSGYKLRHNWAHGLVTDGHMVNPGILSLWWTMWRLVMWPWRNRHFPTQEDEPEKQTDP
jgi:hypothetical protein